MASTIQIKRGTGSAVPSGLADGELAINLDNNKLYFGTGSAVKNDFHFNTITASGDISSSGTITAEDIIINDDLTLGDDATINGNLITFRPTDGSTAVLRLVDDTNDFFTDIKQSDHFHIDLSHHQAMNFAISTNEFDTGTAVDYTATTANSHIFLDGGTGETVIKGTPIYFGNNTDASTAVFNGHITSSANISASGDVTANAYNIQGKTLTTFASDILQHGFDSSLIKYSYGKDSDNEHLFYGDITASGAISSSQTITANTVTAATMSPTRITGGVRTLDQTAQSTVGSNAQGDIFYSEASISTDAGKIYKLQTNGNITLADKDEEMSAESLICVAIGGNSQTNGMLLKGMVKLAADPYPGGEAALGAVVYMGDSGAATGSIAGHATDDYIRIVGHYMSGSGTIYFNPDNTFIKKA